MVTSKFQAEFPVENSIPVDSLSVLYQTMQAQYLRSDGSCQIH